MKGIVRGGLNDGGGGASILTGDAESSDVRLGKFFYKDNPAEKLEGTAEILYKPSVWNDNGVYSYFYIDFGQAVDTFSTGMLQQSIIVHDSALIPITGFSYVSPGIYKIYADISNRFHGVTVLGKLTTLLRFTAGNEVMPVFSVFFYVLGIAAYLDIEYLYECLSCVLPSNDIDETAPTIDASTGTISTEAVAESINWALLQCSSTTDNAPTVVKT